MNIRYSAGAMLLAMALLPAILFAQEENAGKDVGREIGQTAPEIVGKDVNGKAMKLSAFRGKIVVLDFFGDW